MIIVFILLTSMLLIYFFVIAIIIKKKNDNSELIVISPPHFVEKSETDTVTKDVEHDSDSGDRYLKLIVKFLLEQAHEPFKIVKFIDSIEVSSDREFILSQIKYYNLKLHDTVISLLGINTENIAEFESENIDMPDDMEIPQEIRMPSQTEDILMGGIPYQLLQEFPLRDINDLFDYWNKINETYVAHILTEEQKKQIDRNAEALLIPRKPKSTKITKSIITESFIKGEQIAKEIAKKID